MDGQLEIILKAIAGRVMVALLLLDQGMNKEAIEVLDQLDRVLPMPDDVNLNAALACAKRAEINTHDCGETRH